MPAPHRRLLVIAIALAAGIVVSAQPQQAVAVRITSPADDAYLSGLVRLVAVIEPLSATRNVKEVVFFADAKKICTVTRQPFQCEWDAGDRVVEHTIRVTAELAKGERVVATVHTRGVKFAEAVDVDVVQLTAVVTDGGRFVTGLKPEDFKVYDNDRPQPITSFESENISLEMVAALDVSSSMREALPRVKESATRFLAGLRGGDHVTLLAFNDIVYTLAQRTRDQSARAMAIERMRAWGGTALYDVVVDALRRLERQTGRRSLLIFSDGDDQSSHATFEAAMAHAEGSEATIYAIGQGRAVRTRDLQAVLSRFAEASGGRAFFTEDVDKLDKFFEEILEDLSNQYLISYSYPDPERDGQWHKVRLEAAGGKYQVRVRPGYRLIRN
ncbi:MAG TPA: VWA domain-containing protein [Vicinamibacterales bacterium]|jgi:VWFA-related protein